MDTLMDLFTFDSYSTIIVTVMLTSGAIAILCLGVEMWQEKRAYKKYLAKREPEAEAKAFKDFLRAPNHANWINTIIEMEVSDQKWKQERSKEARK